MNGIARKHDLREESACNEIFDQVRRVEMEQKRTFLPFETQLGATVSARMVQ